jgi:DNA-binding MarR family transcriptional regulator
LILHKIIREGEQRLGSLAEQLDFTSGAITALSDKLETGGYTVRKRKEDDRRTVLLGITDKGREMYDGRAARTYRSENLKIRRNESWDTQQFIQQEQPYITRVKPGAVTRYIRQGMKASF